MLDPWSGYSTPDRPAHLDTYGLRNAVNSAAMAWNRTFAATSGVMKSASAARLKLWGWATS